MSNKPIKKIIFLIFISFLLTGEGYKGTLPDLNNVDIKPPMQDAVKPVKNNDILPLDKLTIPVSNTVVVDKKLLAYKTDMQDVLRQIDRLNEILKNDKSFKNYVAAANVLDLTTENILEKHKEKRFQQTNKILDDINYDVQQIKIYWIKIVKNAPYVSAYETQGAYSGAVLNEQLNRFSNVLEHASRNINSKLQEIQ